MYQWFLGNGAGGGERKGSDRSVDTEVPLQHNENRRELRAVRVTHHCAHWNPACCALYSGENSELCYMNLISSLKMLTRQNETEK